MISLPMGIQVEKIKDGVSSYQLVPDMTISNIHCSDDLVKALHNINKTIKSRVVKNNKKYSLYNKDTCTYEIYLSNEKIKFTLIIPNRYDNFIDNKLKNSWQGMGILKNLEDEDYIKVFENDDTLTCDLKLKNHFFMPLLTDRSDTSTLGSILNMTKNLVDDDKLLFQLILSPLGNGWKMSADSKYEAYKNNKNIANNKSVFATIYNYLYEFVLEDVLEMVNELIASIMGCDSVPFNEQKKKTTKEINKIDTTKTMFDGFNTRIRLFSYSKNEVRRRDNLNSFIVAFRSFDMDNSLEPTNPKKVIKIKRELGRYSFLYPQVLNAKEVQKFITLPNGTMQRQYKQLKTISNKQTDLPKLAFDEQGIKIGLYNFKGRTIDIRFSKLINDIAQAKALISPQGGGKTTLMQNYIYEAYKKHQPVIVIDHVQGCELTNEIIPYIDKDRLVVINLYDMMNQDVIQGLGYNEMYSMLDSDNIRTRLKGANKIATQLSEFLNSVTLGATESLSSQMIKFLSSACRVVYATNKDSSIMDVYYCLDDHDIRQGYIDKAIELKVYTEEHVDIKNLKSLTKIDKGVATTKTGDIKGVLNRFAGIQALDLDVMELFSNKVDTSIDFNKFIDEDKIVFIQIPQKDIENDSVRDILTTFFCTKLWVTCQSRDTSRLKLTHLILDEASLIPTTNTFLSKYITQFRRHLLSTLFACHNPEQFQKAFSNINSSGLNLIIMNNIKYEAFKPIENDLVKFNWNDVQDLKSRHAIVTTTYDNETYEFVVELQDKFFKRKKV